MEVVTIKLMIRHDKLQVQPQISKGARHNSQAGCYVQIVGRCYASVAGTRDKIIVTSNSERHTGTTKMIIACHSPLQRLSPRCSCRGYLGAEDRQLYTVTEKDHRMLQHVRSQSLDHSLEPQPGCVLLCKQTGLIWRDSALSTIARATTSQFYYLLSYYTKYRCCKV